jgi:hypothetical protein
MARARTLKQVWNYSPTSHWSKSSKELVISKQNPNINKYILWKGYNFENKLTRLTSKDVVHKTRLNSRLKTHEVEKEFGDIFLLTLIIKRRYTFVIYLSLVTCWQYITDIGREYSRTVWNRCKRDVNEISWPKSYFVSYYCFWCEESGG